MLSRTSQTGFDEYRILYKNAAYNLNDGINVYIYFIFPIIEQWFTECTF